FRALFENYWHDLLTLDPALALSTGDYSAEERFDESLTDDWRTRMLAMLHRYSVALAKFEPGQLSDDDRTSYSMLRYSMDRDLNFYGSRLFETARMLTINQFQGLHVQYAVEAAGSGAFPYKTVADYERALQRADSFARWVDSAIQRMREGMAQNIVLPGLI